MSTPGTAGPGGGTCVTSRLVTAARACYPAWWKERYGDEVAVLCDDLLAGGRRPGPLAAGLVAGALDARLRGTGIPPVASVYRRHAQGSLVTATVPVLVTFPLTLWILGSTATMTTGGTPRLQPVHLGSRTLITAAGLPRLGTAGHMASDAGAVLALLAVTTFMVLTVAWRQVRPVLAHRGRAGRGLWWAPMLLGVTALGIAVLRARLVPTVASTSGAVVHGRATEIVAYAPGGHPAVAAALAGGVWAAFALMLVSAVALAVVAGRSDLGLQTLRTGVGIGRLLTTTAALSAATVTVWAVGLARQPVPARHADYAVVHSSLAPWSDVLAAFLLIAAAITLAGARRARRYALAADRLPAAG